MSASHPLLTRLLRKAGASADAPPSAEAWQRVLALVGRALHDADQDRYTLERSIEISSQEMQGLYQELKRETRRLADVANRTSNAVVIADRAGRVEWVNDSFTQLTGFTLDEVVGRSPGSILQGPSTRDDVRQRMREAVAAAQPFDVEICNYAKSGRMYFVRISTRVTYDDAGQPAGFVAVQTDVTDRRIAMRREALAQRTAALLLEAPSREAAADGVLRALVEELEVVAATLWAKPPGRGELACVMGVAAASAGAAGEAFVAGSRQQRLRPGEAAAPEVGLPGMAWGRREVTRVDGLADPAGVFPNLPRQPLAAAAGIDVLCAAPVVGPDGVVAVLEVASRRGHPMNDLLPVILARLGEQLAAFSLRDASRRAFQAMFERNPDALLLVGEGGLVQAANTRAVALFGACTGVAIDAVLDGGLALVAEAVAHPERAPGLELLHRTGRTAAGAEFAAEVSVAVTDDVTRRAAIVAVRDLTERRRMEQALTESLREKETLLREIHHRVKNNLQIVSSLLGMQLETMPSAEARALLEESVYRVRSMALVHQHLYGVESIVRIDLGSYARELTDSLRHGMAPGLEVSVAAAPLEVTIEHAVPLGLVLNELVTNAIKYGARGPGGSGARVGIDLQREGDQLVLQVHDSGPGVPAGFDVKKARGLGLQIVRSLTRQLRGSLTVHNDNGAVFRVACPLPAA